METILQGLRTAGLTGAEARAYLCLLHGGPMLASVVAKKTHMDRTLAYQVLNRLIEKGVAHYTIRSGRKSFQAATPENLLNSLKARQIVIEDIIPSLKRIEKEKESVRDVSVFEGKEGLRTVIRLFMKSKSLASLGATGGAYDALYEMPRLAAQVAKKKKGWGRILVAQENASHPMTRIRGIAFRYLNFKGSTTTTILDDAVAIHCMEHSPFVVLINSKTIAHSYREHFDILWDCAKKP